MVYRGLFQHIQSFIKIFKYNLRFKGWKNVRHLKRLCECAVHDEQVLTQDKKVKFEMFITLLDIDFISIKKGRFDKLYKRMETWGLYAIFAKNRKIRAGWTLFRSPFGFTLWFGFRYWKSSYTDALISVKKLRILKSLNILNLIKKGNTEELSLHILVSFRILPTMSSPVTVGDGRFSKLKLIKTYSRQSMFEKDEFCSHSFNWKHHRATISPN